MKRYATMLGLCAMMALTTGCSKPDNAAQSEDSAQADAAISSAGDDLKAGLDKFGDAASHTADSIEASGKELAKKSKAAAADAASDASTAADRASSKLRD